MGLPRTFVGLSSTDIKYYYLMLAWKKNENIDFNFANCQLHEEILSENESVHQFEGAKALRAGRQVRSSDWTGHSLEIQARSLGSWGCKREKVRNHRRQTRSRSRDGSRDVPAGHTRYRCDICSFFSPDRCLCSSKLLYEAKR